MGFTNKLTKYRGVAENVTFLVAFVLIMYNLVLTYWNYIYDAIKSRGLYRGIVDSVFSSHYIAALVSVIFLLNASCLLWEILTSIVHLLKQEKAKKGFDKYKMIFQRFSVSYKPSFLALSLYELLPKLFLVHMFWVWQPHFQKLGLFTTNLQWYSWIYALVCWEFATWIFHYSSHRVRIFWCLHAPHHAPSEINMAVNWVHFFAESYYSTFVHLAIMVLLGVNPVMYLPVIALESGWARFIHVSEKTMKNGHLGILQYLIITPAHHRVHHAKSPLYIDTNFANIVPVWDWLFGTLQPLKEEVKLDYGVTRDLDVTNFSDVYFGEILLLYRDVKSAEGIKNKLLYLVKPPGWTPRGSANTAAALKRDFLKTNPELASTSRNKILAAIRSRPKADQPQLSGAEITEGEMVPVTNQST